MSDLAKYRLLMHGSYWYSRLWVWLPRRMWKPFMPPFAWAQSTAQRKYGIDAQQRTGGVR